MGKGVHSPHHFPTMGKVNSFEGVKKTGGVEQSLANGLNSNMELAPTRNDGNQCGLPLVVALNCLPDPSIEEEALAGVALVEHVSLAQVAEGKIETAAAVLLHSLAYLPRAAQRRLQPWQLILSLSCMDKVVDSTLANELGLQLVHVDSGRAEEVADTVMALLLGLLRHTHVLASQGYASAGWLGTMHPSCRGMHRSKGMVLGIVGSTASACAVAVRSLAFRMKVIYFDPEEEIEGQTSRRVFPGAVKKVETLKELLSASDIVTLHCPLTNDTVQLINAGSLQHIKRGAVLVNTSSSHLLDDCALKQALIDGTVAGCALDGVEGPSWVEAWVREMPNVLILPHSADYSEEVWAEIRAKAVAILCSFLVDGIIPTNAASEDDDDYTQDSPWQDETPEKPNQDNHIARGGRASDQRMGDTPPQEFRGKQLFFQNHNQRTPSQDGALHELTQCDQRHNQEKGMGKKGKKRSNRRKLQSSLETLQDSTDQEHNWVAIPRDDRGVSVNGQDSIPTNSNSGYGSPEDKSAYQEDGMPVEGGEEGETEEGEKEKCAVELLKEGLVIALHALSGGGYYVARQRGPGRGWCLDTMSDVTARDPAAQFLVVVRNKVMWEKDAACHCYHEKSPILSVIENNSVTTAFQFVPSVCAYPGLLAQERIGLRSLAAGGKLLQANKKFELVFVKHTFDAWESWIVDGPTLSECSLTNSKFRSVTLDVAVEVLAAVSEDDGVARWLS